LISQGFKDSDIYGIIAGTFNSAVRIAIPDFKKFFCLSKFQLFLDILIHNVEFSSVDHRVSWNALLVVFIISLTHAFEAD